MSLYIKGIDLPKKGEMIEVTLYHDGEVYARRVSNWNDETNIPNITAIPIPTPHGRLIDFTKLEFEDVAFDKVTINAPTVIESED